jgi:transposase
MLLDLKRIAQVYLVCGRTDLRRGIDGLAGIVQEQYELDPYCQNLYLFCGVARHAIPASIRHIISA